MTTRNGQNSSGNRPDVFRWSRFGQAGLRHLEFVQRGDRNAAAYPIGYDSDVPGRSLLERARTEAGLTRQELARRAGTSRPTLSAYEHGHKSPRLDTVERILGEAGFALTVLPRVSYRQITSRRRRIAYVPDRLVRLPVEQALGRVELPLHLDWSSADRTVDLADRRQRARCYEAILREGTAEDIGTYIDGTLLVDLWQELVLPVDIHHAWQPLIDEALSR
jgi:transcriptional regulator with XRE-family HTH domain